MLTADFDQIVGIPDEGGVAGGIVGGQVGLARAHVIEEHQPKVVREGRRHKAPHVLITTESMSEHHGAGALSRHRDVVAP